MSIPTVNVLITAYEQDGSPAAGAKVSAKLMTIERYNGFVVPDEYSGVTDNNGSCTIALFPNELGTEGSEYKFKILHRNGKAVTIFASIPNQNCSLHQVSELNRYELRGAGDIISSELLGYANTAIDARDAAMASEISASSYAADAGTQATVAAGQASIASAKANEASASAIASQASAGNAASSATTASTHASNASAAKVAAESARDLANSYKVAAQSAEAKAKLWADQTVDVTVETGKYSAKHHAEKAAASATAASTSKDTATTKASEAAASATTALGHANDAKAYRDTAATHAANALTSKNAAAVSAGNASTSASTASTKAAEAVVSAGQALTYRDQCEDFYQGMVAEGLHGHNNKTILDATTASFTTAEKDKLGTVALNANNYTHPATHAPSVIAQDSNNRFVTDAEKTNWNAKAETSVATTSANGLMSSTDKAKIDGVAANANNYVHPTGDGNSHVPATGTGNNGKVLKAGPTANSAFWGNLTKAEVGLGNVDNTSDMNKPISTATQAALNSDRYNHIINGNFDIWQRGTGQTASGYGSADRWVCGNTGTTKTASRQSFTLGQTEVPGNPRYYMRHVVTSVAGASNFANIYQKIEGVSTLAGTKATLSFWAKADAPKNIAVEFAQSFGTGGTPSDYVFSIGSQLVALTTSWTKYTVTVDITGIAGKTLGTSGNDCLVPHFWFDAGSSFASRTANLGQQSGTFDIANVSLVEGDIDVKPIPRSYGEELALCYRYYRVIKHYPPTASTGYFSTYTVDLAPPLRATPIAAITLIDAGGTQPVAVNYVHTQCIRFSCTANSSNGFYFYVDAEL